MKSSPYYCPACDTRIQRNSNALGHLETIHDNRGCHTTGQTIWWTRQPKLPCRFGWMGNSRDGDDLRGVDGRRPDNDAMLGPQPKTEKPLIDVV